MNCDFTPSEIEFLAELLEAAHRQKLHELHHTATRAYAHLLREKLQLIESLRSKIETVRTAPTA